MKQKMMKKLVLPVALLMSLSLLAGCQRKAEWVEEPPSLGIQPDETEETTEAPSTVEVPKEEDVTVRIGALSGPTAFGLVSLMDQAENGDSLNTYEFADFQTDASFFVAPIVNGELDIAMVPANLASVLYNKTNGGVQVLAINTLCVLNIVERGNTVQTLSDLEGKTVYATGQGAVPEYVLRYLLEENNVDYAKVDVKWCADTTEALAFVTKEEGAIAMLPQPFVTVAETKVEDLRVAIDLNEEWNALDNGSEQVTGVAVVRREFAEEYPQTVADFLLEYSVSANDALNDLDSTAKRISDLGIVPEPVAKKALPNCHLTFETGKDMQENLSSYLDILYEMDPSSVGGALPEEDFYYIPAE